MVDRDEWPFAPRRVELGGGEALSVTDVGQGPVVVFSHGTPTWSYEWRHHLKALSKQYRCIAPDHLGFGLSPRPHDGDYRPEAHARRFGRLLEVLGVERYHLVVHDYGGPFALDAALSKPAQVESLTAFNTFAWQFGDTAARRRQAWLAGTRLFRWAYGALNLSFALARSAWGSHAKATRETWAPYLPIFPDAASRRRVLWALAKGMSASAGFCNALWERRAALSSTPMHFVWGMKDHAFGPGALARFREAFPHASVLELARAGHWPHEEAPAECVASVERFLAGVRARPAISAA